LPTYTYRSAKDSKTTQKRLETTMLSGLAFMLSFFILSVFHPEFRSVLKGDHRIFPAVLVFMYLLFLLPSRRLLRFQRFGQTSLNATRRGFTYKDAQGEKIFSWRDISQARVLITVDRRHQAFPNKIILVHSKGRIQLENDPPMHELEGTTDLVKELVRRVPAVTFSFHWFHAVCPFCKTELARGGSRKECPGCGRPVQYVSKVLRPWEILREEGLYLLLILLVAGPLLAPLALLYVLALFVGPLLYYRVAALKPLDLSVAGGDAEDSGEPGDPAGPSPTPSIVAGFLGLLLMLGALASPPASSAPWPGGSASPTRPGPHAPAALPIAGGPEYFPLSVGNTWEYATHRERILVRVTRRENVNETSCYVVESFVGGASEASQVEYYAVTPQGVQVLKRTHAGSEYLLKSPETMLAFPLLPGRHWTWQGDDAAGQVLLAFSISKVTLLEVLGRKVPALLVVLHGRSADGSELQTKRWYSPGIGMVRELTLLKKGARSMKVEATLVDFKAPSGPQGLHEEFSPGSPN
jgi:hypothetical protein